MAWNLSFWNRNLIVLVVYRWLLGVIERYVLLTLQGDTFYSWWLYLKTHAVIRKQTFLEVSTNLGEWNEHVAITFETATWDSTHKVLKVFNLLGFSYNWSHWYSLSSCHKYLLVFMVSPLFIGSLVKYKNAHFWSMTCRGLFQFCPFSNYLLFAVHMESGRRAFAAGC